MPSVRFGGEAFELEGDETVLECLERNGVVRPSSCRNGHCQVCTMTCQQGVLPANSQVGLAPTQVQLGAFLPCVCRPSEDLSLEAKEFPILSTKVLEHELVAPDIACIRLARPDSLELIAGQFIHVCKDEETRRSYSVANRAMQDHFVEIHVRCIPGGTVSPWLVEDLCPGDLVSISGPYGACFYTEQDPEQSLVLAGTSTGLAPLMGILRDALARGHSGSIDLYHGATSPEGLYLRDTLKEIASAHNQVKIHWSTLNGATPENQISDQPIDALIREHHPDGKALRAYLCGAPGFVKQIKRELFLSGTPFQQIFSDPFSS